MNGAKAPPPPHEPTFDNIAKAFGLTEEQLAKLVTSPHGSQTFQQLAQNAANQYGHGLLGGQGQAMNVAAQQSYQNAMMPPPRPISDEELMERALKKMNPIAREKYEPVFKLLNIKLRYGAIGSLGPDWTIQKQAANGLQYRMTWSAPTDDVGCALSTWDSMVGELLDQCKRVDDVPRNNHST